MMLSQEKELVAQLIQHVSGCLFAAVLLWYMPLLITSCGAVGHWVSNSLLLPNFAWLMSAAPGAWEHTDQATRQS